MRYSTEQLLPICPVCGYDRLNRPPYNEHGDPSHEICPCCGYEFGHSDSHDGNTFEEFRSAWLRTRMGKFKWREEQPEGWDETSRALQMTNTMRVAHYRPRFILAKHKQKLPD